MPELSFPPSRNRARTVLRAVAGLAAAAAGHVAALEPEVPRLPAGLRDAGGAVTAGATGRVVVHGPSPADTVPALAWAEDVAGRVERILGLELPLPRGYPVRLFLRRDPAVPGGTIFARHVTDPGGISPRLGLLNPEALDAAETLDAFVALLVDRCVAERQPRGSREAGLRGAPAWFSVGLAQHLFAEERARAETVAARRWRAGEGRTLAEVLALERLPPGRLGDRPFCGAALAFLASRPGFAARVRGWLDAWAAGPPPDAARFAREFAGAEDLRALEIEWDLWLASRTRARRPWGEAGPGEVRELRARLALPRALLASPAPPDAPDPVTPEALIERLGEDWVPGAARQLLAALGRGAVAAEGERRQIAREYAAVLGALARPPARGWRAWFRPAPRPGTLRERLARTDARLAELARESDLRSHYLDAVERAGDAAADRAGGDALRVRGDLTVEQRARVAQYLDAVEHAAP